MTVVNKKANKETIGITAEMIHVLSQEELLSNFVMPLVNERNYLKTFPKASTYEVFYEKLCMYNIGANSKQNGITKSLKNDGYNPAYGTITVIPFWYYYVAFKALVDNYYYYQFLKKGKLNSTNNIIEKVSQCHEIMEDDTKTFDQKINSIKKETKGMYVPVSGITRFSRLCKEGVIFERLEGSKKVKRKLPFSLETFSTRFAATMKETFEDSHFSEEIRCRSMRLCILYLLSRYNIDSRSAEDNSVKAFRANFIEELMEHFNDKENIMSRTNNVDYFENQDMFEKIKTVVSAYFGDKDAMFGANTVPYLHQCLLAKKLYTSFGRQSVGRYTKFMANAFTKNGLVEGCDRHTLMRELGINPYDLSYSERKVEMVMEYIDENLKGRPASYLVGEFKKHLENGNVPLEFFEKPSNIDVDLENAKKAISKLLTHNQLAELKSYIAEMEETLA